MTVMMSFRLYDRHFPDRMPRNAPANNNILSEQEKARRIAAQAERDYAAYITYIQQSGFEFLRTAGRQIESHYGPGRLNLPAAQTGAAFGLAHALFSLMAGLEDSNAMMVMEEINTLMQGAINQRKEGLSK